MMTPFAMCNGALGTALFLSSVLTLGACDTAKTTALPARSWRMAAENAPGGVIMSGALLADKTPLLVGGQSDLGGAWLWQGGKLVDEQPPAGKLLAWVSLVADGTALVVGNGKRALWRTSNGQWTSESTVDGEELWGCLAFSQIDAWAVGDNPNPDASASPVLVHRDANGWAPATLPALSSPKIRLFKIDGHSSTDVVAVGDDGVALHWNGQAWLEEPTGTGSKLTTVRAQADGTYLAVGGQETGILLQRDKAGKWTTVHDAKTGLSGLDTFDGSIWACGDAGWLEQDSVDGKTSTELSDTLTNDSLHFVLRLPSGDALAGGGNLAAWPGKMHGTLLQWSL